MSEYKEAEREFLRFIDAGYSHSELPSSGAIETAIKALEEFAELAKVKAEGQLIISPVADNTVVYGFNKGKVVPILITTISKSYAFDEELEFEGLTDTPFDTDEYYFKPSDIGKTVFLTRETAEAALKQNGGGQD